MKTRIVFIPHSPHFGGAEKQLIELVRSVGGQQDCVIWYDPVDFYSQAFHDRPNTQVLLRPYRMHHRTVFKFWRDLIQLKPRVVVFSKGIADIYPWSVYLAARLCGAERVIAIEQLIADPAPLPIAEHGMKGLVRRLFGWRTRYMFGKQLQGRFVDVTVAVSEAVRKRLVDEYHYPAEKTITIYNGVDLTFFKEGGGFNLPRLDGESLCPDKRLRIICVARLSPVKRIDVLLESLALLAKSRTDWTCTIIGGGPLEKELKEKSQALGLSSCVRFTGHVQDVHSFMQKADLAVLSSDKEGLPLSLVEAMACGLPCVVTDVGGNREIVQHGITGLVVEAGSPKQLAEGIAYVLNHSEEREKMGQAARSLAYERFDLSCMIDEYKALLLPQFHSSKPPGPVVPMRQST